MLIEWNEEKNIKLSLDSTRWNISFEDIKQKLLKNEVVYTEPNKNYPNQDIYLFDFDWYPVACALIKTEEKYFLKTLYKCRKFKKILKEKKK